MKFSTIIQKLSSRKLWLAIAGVATGIALALGVQTSEITTVAGAVTAIVSVVTYIVTEGMKNECLTCCRVQFSANKNKALQRSAFQKRSNVFLNVNRCIPSILYVVNIPALDNFVKKAKRIGNYFVSFIIMYVQKALNSCNASNSELFSLARPEGLEPPTFRTGI